MMSRRFNDILVIDDLDDCASEAADLEDELDDLDDDVHSEEINDFFDSFFSSSTNHIKLIKSFCDAGDEIIDHSNRYNLIIFDLDMRKGFFDPPKRKKDLDKKLKEYNIDLSCSSDSFNAKDGFNGIYLYLLLLSKGFPSERMVILTGNSSGKAAINKGIKEKCSSLCIKDSLIRIKGDKLNIDIQFYSDNPEDTSKANEYYRIRRLVFQACSYWREWLKELGKISKAKYENPNEKIPFNSVYSLKGDSAVSVSEFFDLLDHVEMLFPVLRPDKPEKVYYQAAKSICGFHENKANLDKTKNYNQKNTSITKFHSVPRTFRNWSAHNKFENNTMTAEEFALIFCLTLRSYFDEGQNEKDDDKKDFKPERLDYEKDYWLDTPITDSPEELYSVFSEVAKKSLKEINDSITLPTLLNLRRGCDFWTLFFQQGMDKSWKIPSIDYVLFPLLFNDIIIKYPYDIDKLTWKEIDNIPKKYPRKITIKKDYIDNKAEQIYSILSGTDNSVQTLFVRQAFNIIRKNYLGKA